MNYGRIAAAALVVWILSIPIGYLINDVLLTGIFAANAAAVRPLSDVLPRLPIGFGMMLLAYFALAYTYAKGYEGGNGVAEGARFGITIAVVLSGLALVWLYVTFPITGSMVVARIAQAFVEMPIYGAIIGSIYRPLQPKIAM